MEKWDRRYLGAVLAGLLILTFAGGIKYAEIRARSQTSPEIITSQASAGDPAGQPQEAESIQVYVTGAVNKPGVYQLPADARVHDALELGAPTSNADLSRINLAARVEDGQAIYVPHEGEVPTTDGSVPSNPFLTGVESSGKVNINRASVQELDQKLPGIGPSIAQRIVDYRTSHGSFTRVEDLKEVSGIGDKKYADLEDLITVR